MPERRSDKFVYGDDGSAPVLSQCFYCDHLSARPDKAVCRAFPAGIPAEILANQFDHREPWIDPETGEPGDTGLAGERSITFEPRDDAAPEALAALYRHLDAEAD